MIVAGIDPGKSGALFVYDAENSWECDCMSVPSINSGPNGKPQPDFPAWNLQWSPLLKKVSHVFIEQVGAMPKQGVTSMFSFGYSSGFMYGLVVGLGLPHTFLLPRAWKKTMGLSGSDGEQSRRKASQLLPSCAGFWPRKKDDGRAEAALIALAGYKMLTS